MSGFLSIRTMLFGAVFAASAVYSAIAASSSSAPSPSREVARADAASASAAPTPELLRQWKRLLHYRGDRSDVASPGFFLSPDGARDPRKEWARDLEVFSDPRRAGEPHGTFVQPAACAFPARREFLERATGTKFPPIACAAYEEWKGGVQARSASLVFSSIYAGNPASMFGHTLLRLNRGAKPARDPRVGGSSGGGGERDALEVAAREGDLLSYGANFSASVPEGEGPVAYAMRGLFGAYIGRYDLAPYYRKVNEYSVAENRDLWEYDLSLSPEETDRLVAHLWELYSDGFFPYYFLNRNCSYRILTALEAIRPDWDLSRGFSIYALPAETVKRLVRQPGAVVSVTLRPSQYRAMRARVAALSPSERGDLARLLVAADAGKDAAGTGAAAAAVGAPPMPDAKPAVYDAALAVEQYRGKNASDAGFRSLLFARSRLPKAEAVSFPDAAIDERPDRSHGPMRISLAAGREEERGAPGAAAAAARATVELSFSAFTHDLLDETPSYNAFSQVRILGAQGIFVPGADSGSRAFLRSADLFAMKSEAPFRWPERPASWQVALSFARPADRGFMPPPVWRVGGGYGLALGFFGDRALISVLPSAEVEKGAAFAKGARLGAGGDVGLTARLARAGALSFSARGSWRHDVFDADPGQPANYARAEAGFAYAFSPFLQLRAEAEFMRARNEERLSAEFRY